MNVELQVQQSDPSWLYVSWSFLDAAPEAFVLRLEKRTSQDQWALCYDVAVDRGSSSWHLVVPEPGLAYRVALCDDSSSPKTLATSAVLQSMAKPRIPKDEAMRLLHELSGYDQGLSSWS